MSSLDPGTPSWRTTADDGRRVTVELSSAGGSGPGPRFVLLRLRWTERNRIVQGAQRLDPSGLELNPLGYADQLLLATAVAARRGGAWRELEPGWLDELPLALADRLLSATLELNRRRPLPARTRSRDTSVELELADRCFLLQPWSWATRRRVLEASLTTDASGTLAADGEAFAATVLKTTCRAVDEEPIADPAAWLEALPADVGDALLEASLRLHALGAAERRAMWEAIRSGRPHELVETMALCDELGWRPSELRREAARDVDALLAVRQASATTPPAPQEQTAASPSELVGETLIVVGAGAEA